MNKVAHTVQAEMISSNSNYSYEIERSSVKGAAVKPVDSDKVVIVWFMSTSYAKWINLLQNNFCQRFILR